MSRLKKPLKSVRRIVAREAASLLYNGQEKEYFQAKRRAAQSLGFKVLPANLEVAEELDKLADELEGASRRDMIIEMRREALEVMDLLADFQPRLTGSVWRGTARRSSDIDIDIHHPEPQEVLQVIAERGLEVMRIEWKPFTAGDDMKTVLHIHTETPSGRTVEVMIRGLEELEKPRICEIYGDKITGLDRRRLREVLEKDPSKRFIPHRKLNSKKKP